MHSKRRLARIIAATVALPVITVAALWLPFGFSLGGLIEEWGFLELFARKGVFYIITDATLHDQKARPLHILPQALAYTLDPDTFLFWHIIQAAGLVAKAASAAVIGLYLIRNYALAASLGLLTLLYPADTMQMSFRSLSDNWAVALALLAIALFTLALRVEVRSARVAVGVVASGILAAGLLMWEAVAGLSALPLLLVFAREGKGAIKTVRERADLFLVWALTTVAWFGFFVSAVRSGSGYQATVLSGVTRENLLGLISGLASSGLYRGFYDGWLEVVHILTKDISNFAYPLAFTILVFLALSWLAKEGAARTTPGRWQLAGRIVAAGPIAFALGYAPFLASYSHLLITQRTFLAAAIGGALVFFGIAVYLFSITDRRVAAALSALLIGGCLVAQLYQFDRYNRIYASAYRPVLSAIMPFIASSVEHGNVVLFSDFGYMSVVWDFGLELKPAIGYLLPESKASRIFICEMRSGRLLPRWRGEPERRYCHRTPDAHSVVVTSDGRTVAELNQASIATLNSAGAVSIDESQSETKWGKPPSRVARLLRMPRWNATESMFRRGEDAGRYDCRFEYMWGYAVPCRTFGFFEPEPLLSALGASYAWIGETNAGLIFDVEPRQSTYKLVVEILDVVAQSRKMQITLNGTTLFNGSQVGAGIEVTFPGSLLRHERNFLEFGTELNKNMGLSFALKSISVAPDDKQYAP